MARKTSEGMSKKEAARCLCRFVAREMFKRMTGPQEPLPDGGELAARRRELGVTQKALAEAAGLTVGKLRDAEQGRVVDGERLRTIEAALASVAAGRAAAGAEAVS